MFESLRLLAWPSSSFVCKDIPRAALSYLMMAFALFDPTQYKNVTNSVLIFILLILFQICIFVFLLNLLIAQLCSKHKAMYEDIVGYARIQRIITIYATIPYVPVPTWTKWIDSLMLDEKLEFGVGDIGVNGSLIDFKTFFVFLSKLTVN